jgi:cell wall-associated NlpC family hydrolase
VIVSAVFSIVVLASPGAGRAEPAADLEKRIDRQAAALKALGEDYNAANEQLTAAKAAAVRHAATLPTLEAQRGVAEEAVEGLVTEEYKSGNLRGAAAVLGGDSGALLGRLSVLEQLANTRQESVDALTEARDRYATVTRQLAGERAKQDALVQSLASRKTKAEKDLDALYDLRTRAFGQGQEAGSRYTGAVPAVSGKAGVAVRFAFAAIGKPYVFASAGPGSYDCSGLTLAAWRAAGKSLPHNVKLQWGKVAHIGRADLKPGDLVFYTDLSHIGIYVGDNNVIHAPTFGQSVKLSKVSMLPIVGYGRVN